MKTVIARHLIPIYFALTFASSWALWFASGVLDYSGGLPPLDRGWLLAQIGVFCPSLWALVLAAILHPEKRKSCLAVLVGVFVPAAGLGLALTRNGTENPVDLPPGMKWVIMGWALVVVAVVLLPRRLVLTERKPLDRRRLGWLAAAGLQLPVFFLVGWVLVNQGAGELGIGVTGQVAGSAWATLGVLFAFDLIFGGALGEEMGWRGFALPVMLGKAAPLGAALVLGVVWALWHLPIDVTAGFGAAGLAGVVFRLLFTCSLSVIMTWHFIRSGHGLMSALLIHTTLNWLPVMEFSNYEPAMGALFILMMLFALAVGFGDPAMRADPAPAPDRSDP